MKFVLIDKITAYQPGESIRAMKSLSLAEEYLGDHFPAFPVLPGVLMIEALVQAAAMLVRLTNDFSHSMVLLSEARNVKYKSFVKPGNILEMDVQAKRIEAAESVFSGEAYVGETSMMSARLKLRHFNLADEDPDMAELDRQIVAEMRQRARITWDAVSEM